MKYNEFISRLKWRHILISIASIALLVILYLFALNGRYIYQNYNLVFDKWTSEFIEYKPRNNRSAHISPVVREETVVIEEPVVREEAVEEVLWD